MTQHNVCILTIFTENLLHSILNKYVYILFNRHRFYDLDLKNESDMIISIDIGDDYYLSYIHTQRYFQTFLAYWMDFVELQDQVYKLNNKHLIQVIFSYMYNFIRP